MRRSWSNGSRRARADFRGARGVTKVEVLFEDNHCLAVNKAAGTLSQGDISGEPSLVLQVEDYLRTALRQAGERVRRALAPARSAGLGRDAAGEDQQGGEPALRPVPVRDNREALLGDRGGCAARRGRMGRRDRKGQPAETVRAGFARECVRERSQGPLPCRQALAAIRQDGAATGDRAKPPASRAACGAGLADCGRQEIRGQNATERTGWPASDCPARPGADLHAPYSPGSDFGRGAPAGRLARAFASIVGTTVRLQ